MSTDTQPGLSYRPRYRGNTVALEAKNGSHWYRVIAPDGSSEVYPSVTTILQCIAKPALVPWAKKVALEKVRATLNEGVMVNGPHTVMRAFNGKWEFDSEWVDAMLEVARKRPDEVRDEAAAEGTDAHSLIDRIMKGETVDVPVALAPAVHGAMIFVQYHGLTPIASEISIWHPVLKYAGTVDLVARDGEGRLVVADWKRSSGLYESAAYQISAYADAITELTGEEVSAAHAVRLLREAPKDGQPPYEAKRVASLWESYRTFQAAWSLWHGLRRDVWAE